MSATASYKGFSDSSPPTSLSASVTASVCSSESFQTAQQSAFSPQFAESFIRGFDLNRTDTGSESSFGTHTGSLENFSPVSAPHNNDVKGSMMVACDETSDNSPQDEEMHDELSSDSAEETEDEDYIASDDEAQMIVTDSTNVRLTRLEANITAVLAAIQSLTAAAAASAQGPTTTPTSRLGVISTRPLGPNRRPADRTALMRQVRAELSRLLGDDFLSFENVLTRDELDVFGSIWKSSTAEPRPSCCDVDNFKVDLIGSPRSDWNQSASRVFAKHFVTTSAYSHSYFPLVQNYFYQRMKSLQAAFRRKNADDAARQAETTAKRRWQRKQNLFHKRLGIAQEHPLLQEHVPILQRLGIAGMSSDESDFEDGPASTATGGAPRYKVHPPAWRASALSYWLQTIDSLQVLFRRSNGKHRGSFPRLRVASGEDSDSKGFVTDLPITAYNPNWLAARPFYMFDVRPTDENYNFNHDNRLFAYFQV
ncbi:hypothetical protein JR316_0012584 [Psilocybe cubensis]|uniref:Uncharacterized protein n=2 Tax=Psilocybe cubensis TaxID=181762 RepID=A0ACB8GIE3_PSICU|nr:hypothetical protein JR316_0012584 [Psilocybe cubensis]KAH9475473.1 hypothetical protein JR316_0012584 [Psilocybe cubensis]